MNHRSPMLQYVISLSLSLLLLLPVKTAASDEDPGKLVMDTVNEVLRVLSNDGLTDAQRRERTYEIVSARIDFTAMSRRIMATNWDKTTDDQKQRFQSLFREILLGTYWQRIRKYTDERVEYITGMIEKDLYATIDTVIITDKVEIPISYRMEFVDEKWMAYDFLVESLSLVTNFRIEYRNLVKLHGIEGLLEEMEKEVGKFER